MGLGMGFYAYQTTFSFYFYFKFVEKGQSQDEANHDILGESRIKYLIFTFKSRIKYLGIIYIFTFTTRTNKNAPHTILYTLID